MLGCCLVSLHFLCYILCRRSVGLTRRGFLKSKYYWGYKSKYCIGWEGGRIMVRLLLCATAICKHTGRHRKDRWDSIQSTCFLLSVIWYLPQGGCVKHGSWIQSSQLGNSLLPLPVCLQIWMRRLRLWLSCWEGRERCFHISQRHRKRGRGAFPLSPSFSLSRPTKGACGRQQSSSLWGMVFWVEYGDLATKSACS